MSTINLESVGVNSLDDIEYYTVRTEQDNDILKVYHKKEKGSLFQRSQKFKFHRHTRVMRRDMKSEEYAEFSEVSPLLTKVMGELDTITQKDQREKSIKEKILQDLRHLEKVVANKVAEIESDLEKL